jgi:hypothetical protein
MPPRKRQPAVSDAPPPLPGGYKVGEKVFFTGRSETFADGDKVVRGQQGEVTGPATLEEAKGKGVNVRFPGNNKDGVDCLLTTVRRLRAASAATPRLRPCTRRCPRPMRSRDSLCRVAPALTACATARAAAHCPLAGVMVAEGVVRGVTASVAAPERVAAEPYTSLLLTAGGCVRR